MKQIVSSSRGSEDHDVAMGKANEIVLLLDGMTLHQIELAFKKAEEFLKEAIALKFQYHQS